VPTHVLLSVKPHFAQSILDGTKRFEFRRVRFRRPDIKTVVLYATSPVCKVVGEFELAAFLSMSPTGLWRVTQRWAGIDRASFDSYFDGLSVAYALRVGHRRKYVRPLLLQRDFGIRFPPQSFQYLS
jgi:predicted transcriptional regulator